MPLVLVLQLAINQVLPRCMMSDIVVTRNYVEACLSCDWGDRRLHAADDGQVSCVVAASIDTAATTLSGLV